MKSVVVIAGMLALTGGALASGPQRHWVYFTDKGYASAEEEGRAAAGLAGTYDAGAVARRLKRRTAPGLFDARDLPVAARYVEAVAAAGAAPARESRWLNAVSVTATPEQLERLAALPFVARVAPVRGGRLALPAETPVEVGEVTSRDFYGYSGAQLRQIGVPEVHDRGMRGQGVVIAVLDTGFVTTHTAFQGLQVVAAHDFVNGDENVGIEAGDHPDQHRHGTWILGCMASYWPDVLVGGAYEASFVLCKTEDVASETPVEEDNYVAGLEFAEAHGAHLCTSSLGYIDWYGQADLDGATAVTTVAVNAATANGVICVTAAGNEGHDANPSSGHLIAPADAMEVITCGAVDELGTIAGFSSDGPTADGRVKPEVLARGVGTFTVSSSDPGNLAQVSGTSLSTPLVAAAVACLYPGLECTSVAEFRSMLFAAAGRRGQADPLFVEGYGIVNAADTIPVDHGCGDYNGDGFLDFFDYDDFVSCFQGGACPCGRTADFNGDGFADFFDYDDFVHAFETGC